MQGNIHSNSTSRHEAFYSREDRRLMTIITAVNAVNAKIYETHPYATAETVRVAKHKTPVPPSPEVEAAATAPRLSPNVDVVGVMSRQEAEAAALHDANVEAARRDLDAAFEEPQ